MSKSQNIMGGIAIALFVGFRLTLAFMDQQIKQDRQPVVAGRGFHSEDFVQLNVHLKRNLTDDEFRAIHMGMTFPQVSQAIHIPMRKSLKEVLPNPEKLEAHVFYLNRNKSSVEVVFRGDLVAHKEKHSAYENSIKDGDGTDE